MCVCVRGGGGLITLTGGTDDNISAECKRTAERGTAQDVQFIHLFLLSALLQIAKWYAIMTI